MQSKFIEIALRLGCSPVNLLQSFWTPFPENTCGRLVLSLVKWLEKVKIFRLRKNPDNDYFPLPSREGWHTNWQLSKVFLFFRLLLLFLPWWNPPVSVKENLCVKNLTLIKPLLIHYTPKFTSYRNHSNQLIGFYMMATLVFNVLILSKKSVYANISYNSDQKQPQEVFCKRKRS